MSGKSQYKLALQITANARKALSEVDRLNREINKVNRTSALGGSFLARGLRRGLGHMRSMSGVAFSLGSVFRRITGVFVAGFRTAFGLVRNISGMLLRLPMKALKLGLIGAGAVAGGAYLGHKLLQPAAKVERYKEQFKVQGTSEMLPWLKKMAMNTTNSLDELIQSTILGQNFRIDMKKDLVPMMDLSNMFNKPLTEIVRSLGMIKAERYGEALESLSRSGITRQDLKELGIKFGSGGMVKDESKDKIYTAVINLIKSRYGGASQRRAKTYEGQVSMLGDAVFNALSEGLAPFLPYATKIVKEVKKYINSVGKALKTVDWKGFGERALNVIKKIRIVAEKMLTGEGRSSLAKDIKNAWSDIKTSIIPAIIGDIKNNISAFIGWIGNELIRISSLMVKTIANWLGSGEATELMAKLGMAFAKAPQRIAQKIHHNSEIDKYDAGIKQQKKNREEIQKNGISPINQVFGHTKESSLKAIDKNIARMENLKSGHQGALTELYNFEKVKPEKYTPNPFPSMKFKSPQVISETMNKTMTSMATPLPPKDMTIPNLKNAVSGLVKNIRMPGKINGEYVLSDKQKKAK